MEKILTNHDKFIDMIRKMPVYELVEYFGGDTLDNALCKFVGNDGRCCKTSPRYKEQASCQECIETFLLTKIS